MTELSDVELMSLKCHVFVSFRQRASISPIAPLSHHMDAKTKKQALIKTKLFKETKTAALMSIFWLKTFLLCSILALMGSLCFAGSQMGENR